MYLFLSLQQEIIENPLKRISKFPNIQRHLQNYESLHLRAKLLCLEHQTHTKTFYINREIHRQIGQTDRHRVQNELFANGVTNGGIKKETLKTNL